MLGHYQDALESSEYAIAIDASSTDALLGKANALYHLGHYEEARDFFHRYSQLTDNSPLGVMNEASCIIAMNQIDEAITMLEKLCVRKDIEPDLLYDIHQQLAFCYGEKQPSVHDKIAGAGGFWKDLKDAYDIPYRILVPKSIDGLLLLSIVYRADDGRLYGFRTDLPFSLPLDPMGTLLQVIVSLYDNGYLIMAHRMMKKFFNLQGKNGHDGYGYMALFCHDMGLEDDYLKYLKLAVTHNPKEAEQALKHIFPKDVEPSQYYTYATQQK